MSVMFRFSIRDVRFRLRTLLILLAILPPLLWLGWIKYDAWRAERELMRARQEWLDRLGAMPPSQALRESSLMRLREAVARQNKEAEPPQDLN